MQPVKDELLSYTYICVNFAGYPDEEITPSGRVPSRLPLCWSREEFSSFLETTFPALKLQQYSLMYSERSNLETFPENVDTPQKIKDFLTSSKKTGCIFVMPTEDITEHNNLIVNEDSQVFTR